MSDTSFKAPSRHVTIDVLFGAFCTAMLAWMAVSPGQETIPFHLLFFSVALVYGFRIWSLHKTTVLIVLISVVSGAAMVTHWQSDDIEAAELIEVPLMPALVAAMIWHAHRHSVANRKLQDQASERAAALVRQRELLRDACHAMRTPVTIARGHLELMQYELTDATTKGDLEVVQAQIDRMARMSARLIALTGLDRGDALLRQETDIAGFVTEIGFNWTPAAIRNWHIVAPTPVRGRVDREYCEIVLDALIENALNFTATDDTIRVECRQEGSVGIVEVADSGPGIADEDRDKIFERYWHRQAPNGSSGSGLGLAAVRSIVEAHGGTIDVGIAAEGGAQLTIQLPLARSTGDADISIDLRDAVSEDLSTDTWGSVRHLQA